MSIRITKIDASIPKEIQGKKLYTVEDAFTNLRKKVKDHFCKKDINI